MTRKKTSNTLPHKPINTFIHIPALLPGDSRDVMKPNFKVLYSIARLDMMEDPIIVSAPNRGGYFYLMLRLDMHSNAFSSPRRWTPVTQAEDFLITPPDWSGEVPKGVTQINAPAPCVWIVIRTNPNEHTGYKITPLSLWGKAADMKPAAVQSIMDKRVPNYYVDG
jgi:hypothetical protein